MFERAFKLITGWIVFLYVAFFTTGVLAEERFALLIGNSRYEHATPLRNPENDIQIVGQSLVKAGFHVAKHANLDAQSMSLAINAFLKTAAASENPVVILYFAGHGVKLKGENYLLPVDVKVDSPGDIAEQALSFSEVQDKFNEINPNLQILILDACRNDPFENGTRGLSRGLSSVEAKLSGSKIEKRIGTMLAFSTNPGNVALDGDSGTSPYASALSESILVPGLNIEDVFKRVRNTVVERTGGKQTPWENAALFGDFYFQDAPAVGVNDNDMDYWELASLSDSIEGMKRYLKKFPDGLFANLARQKIDNMNKYFSYRRKAEVFPIVKLTEQNFKLCEDWNWRDDKNSFSPYSFRQNFNGQVIYLTVEQNYDVPNCKARYNLSVFESGPLNEMFFEGSGQRLRNRNKQLIKSVLREIGSSINIKDIGHIIRQDTWDWNYFFPRERAGYISYGDCEGSCLLFSGLVRVRDIPGEESTYVHFEPVDPAEIGLTWKFQNTLNAVSALKENEYIIGTKQIVINSGSVSENVTNNIQGNSVAG